MVNRGGGGEARVYVTDVQEGQRGEEGGQSAIRENGVRRCPEEPGNIYNVSIDINYAIFIRPPLHPFPPILTIFFDV